MKRQVWAAGLGLGLAFGAAACGNAATHAPETPSTTISMPAHPYDVAPEDRTYVETEYNRYASRLKDLGLIATNTSLVILVGNGTYTCKEPGTMRPLHMTVHTAGEYCASTDSVVLTASTINGARYQGTYRTQLVFLISHELGHARQNKNGVLTEASLSTVEAPRTEEQATCFAGISVEALDPQLVQPIRSAISHGVDTSGPGQANAFMVGVTTGQC